MQKLSSSQLSPAVFSYINQRILSSSNKGIYFYELYIDRKSIQNSTIIFQHLNQESLMMIKKDFQKLPYQELQKQDNKIRQCRVFLYDIYYLKNKIKIKTGQNWLVFFSLSASVLLGIASGWLLWKSVYLMFFKETLKENNEININETDLQSQSPLISNIHKLLKMVGFTFLSAIGCVGVYHMISFFKYSFPIYIQSRGRIQELKAQLRQRIRRQ